MKIRQLREKRTYRAATAAALLAASIVYAWWATSLRPFTARSLWATIAGAAAAVAAGVWWFPPPRVARHRACPRGTAVWAVLLVALCGWELASFLQHPRAAHPTLSSLANDVLAHHSTRTLAMVLWLAIGVALSRP